MIVKMWNLRDLLTGITIANVANLLGPKAYVPAVKSNNFAAGTLQAYISSPRNGVPVHSGLL